MIKVGCCGFPVKRGEYFKHFDLVEVQITFYKFPKENTLERWRKESPKNFEFVIKASQFFTHPPNSPTYRRLGRSLSDEERKSVGFFKLNEITRSAWDKMLRYCKILNSNKLLFQTPSTFKATDENKKNIRDFFGSIDRGGLFILFEPRGWGEDDVREICEELGFYHVVDISEGKKPVTHGFYYFRIHGGKGYKHSYTDEELKNMVSIIKELDGDAYVLFNNISMFNDAKRFKDYLKALE